MKKQKYLDLTYDRSFKTFFSRNKDMLLSLLKAFLPLPSKKSVQSVQLIEDKKPAKKDKTQKITIKDSFLYPDSVNEKQAILDLNVLLNTGEKVDVEMQAVSKKAFVDRTLFYWSRLYTKGLKVSQAYSRLHPTYSLIFTKFPVFGCHKRGVVTSFSIRSDKRPHFVLNNHLRMVFVELSRFKKSEVEDLLDAQDEWCYFLRESGRLSRKNARRLAGKGGDMSKAVSLLDDLSESGYESLLKETKEREYRDQLAVNELIRDEIRDEVLAEGKAAGMKAVALNMLKEKADLAFISKVTGWSIEEIKKLKNGLV